ncbi:hypothetical protein ACLOJK_030804 [Asimina triloba]
MKNARNAASRLKETKPYHFKTPEIPKTKTQIPNSATKRQHIPLFLEFQGMRRTPNRESRFRNPKGREGKQQKEKGNNNGGCFHTRREKSEDVGDMADQRGAENVCKLRSIAIEI